VADRRTFIGTLFGALTAAMGDAFAQQPAKVYRIGFLGVLSAAQDASRLAAFRAGLSDLGYIEGKNIVIEFRWGDGDNSRLPQLAAELVRLNVDVIVTTAVGALAARQATTTIPIVMAIGGDAVATGLATSLARPGGNVTGSTILVPELNVKRLEFLKMAVPRIGRVALLVHEGSPANEPMLRFMESAAKSLNLMLQTFAASAPDAFDSVFSRMANANVDGVVVFEEPMFVFTAGAVVELAAKRRLPLAGFTEIAEAGGLIGYGVDLVGTIRHAAVFVDKILKGANPADMPIEQASKFRLTINLKSAKALSLTIPQSLLLRADELIQ
jgi:putative tryptophan/tyrosine transport system substrate-binding protein